MNGYPKGGVVSLLKFVFYFVVACLINSCGGGGGVNEPKASVNFANATTVGAGIVGDIFERKIVGDHNNTKIHKVQV